MSDQQKGFVEALNELEPNMEHRFCLKHMHENFKELYKGEDYKKLLWRAATAGTEKLFLKRMKVLEEFDKNAYSWVMGHVLDIMYALRAIKSSSCII